MGLTNFILTCEKDNEELKKDINYYKNMASRLKKENQELKKQLDKAHDELYTLKNKYNIRLLNQISENIEPDCEDYYLAEIETKAHKYDLIQNQQKEFIKYLEDEIENINKAESHLYQNRIPKYFELVIVEGEKNATKEILQRFKEIIGVSNDY